MGDVDEKALEELVDEWRRRADAEGEENRHTMVAARQIRECANELEGVLDDADE